MAENNIYLFFGRVITLTIYFFIFWLIYKNRNNFGFEKIKTLIINIIGMILKLIYSSINFIEDNKVVTKIRYYIEKWWLYIKFNFKKTPVLLHFFKLIKTFSVLIKSTSITLAIIAMVLFVILYIDKIKDCVEQEPLPKPSEKWTLTSIFITLTFIMGGFTVGVGGASKSIIGKIVTSIIFTIIGLLIGLLAITLMGIEWPDPVWQILDTVYEFIGLQRDKNKMLFMVFLIVALSIFIIYTTIFSSSDIGIYIAIIVGVIQLILSLELFRFKKLFKETTPSDNIMDIIFRYTPYILLLYSIFVFFIGIGFKNIIKLYCLTADEDSGARKFLC